jgi:hypothetical protein
MGKDNKIIIHYTSGGGSETNVSGKRGVVTDWRAEAALDYMNEKSKDSATQEEIAEWAKKSDKWRGKYNINVDNKGNESKYIYYRNNPDSKPDNQGPPTPTTHKNVETTSPPPTTTPPPRTKQEEVTQNELEARNAIVSGLIPKPKHWSRTALETVGDTMSNLSGLAPAISKLNAKAMSVTPDIPKYSGAKFKYPIEAILDRNARAADVATTINNRNTSSASGRQAFAAYSQKLKSDANAQAYEQYFQAHNQFSNQEAARRSAYDAQVSQIKNQARQQENENIANANAIRLQGYQDISSWAERNRQDAEARRHNRSRENALNLLAMQGMDDTTRAAFLQENGFDAITSAVASRGSQSGQSSSRLRVETKSQSDAQGQTGGDNKEQEKYRPITPFEAKNNILAKEFTKGVLEKTNAKLKEYEKVGKLPAVSWKTRYKMPGINFPYKYGGPIVNGSQSKSRKEAELERGEVVLRPDNKVFAVGGKKHEQGGEKFGRDLLPNNSIIFSDSLPLNPGSGTTPAKAAKSVLNQRKQAFNGQIDDVTKSRLLAIYNNQEQNKDMGIYGSGQLNQPRKFNRGGRKLPKFQTGGEPTRLNPDGTINPLWTEWNNNRNSGIKKMPSPTTPKVNSLARDESYMRQSLTRPQDPYRQISNSAYNRIINGRLENPPGALNNLNQGSTTLAGATNTSAALGQGLNITQQQASAAAKLGEQINATQGGVRASTEATKAASNMAKTSQVASGVSGAVGGIAGLGSQIASDRQFANSQVSADEQETSGGAAKGALSGLGSGAAAGASVGSFIGP